MKGNVKPLPSCRSINLNCFSTQRSLGLLNSWCCFPITTAIPRTQKNHKHCFIPILFRGQREQTNVQFSACCLPTSLLDSLAFSARNASFNKCILECPTSLHWDAVFLLWAAAHPQPQALTPTKLSLSCSAGELRTAALPALILVHTMPCGSHPALQLHLPAIPTAKGFSGHWKCCSVHTYTLATLVKCPILGAAQQGEPIPSSVHPPAQGDNSLSFSWGDQPYVCAQTYRKHHNHPMPALTSHFFGLGHQAAWTPHKSFLPRIQMRPS